MNGPIRRLTSRIPLWARVSGIVALVLVGVLLSTVVLAASGVDDRGDSGGHGTGHHSEMEMNTDGSGGEHDSDNHGSGGDHGADH